MALLALGNAQFAQANFTEAAAAYRHALDLAPADGKLIVTYGDALVARHTPARSLEEYTAWLDAHPELTGRSEVGLQTRLELGRLTLAAKGDAAADAVLFPTVSADAANLPAAIRGRYGWWFYEAGTIRFGSEVASGRGDSPVTPCSKRALVGCWLNNTI